MYLSQVKKALAAINLNLEPGISEALSMALMADQSQISTAIVDPILIYAYLALIGESTGMPTLSNATLVETGPTL